jgi:hypothetical protein
MDSIIPGISKRKQVTDICFFQIDLKPFQNANQMLKIHQKEGSKNQPESFAKSCQKFQACLKTNSTTQ